MNRYSGDQISDEERKSNEDRMSDEETTQGSIN